MEWRIKEDKHSQETEELRSEMKTQLTAFESRLATQSTSGSVNPRAASGSEPSPTSPAILHGEPGIKGGHGRNVLLDSEPTSDDDLESLMDNDRPEHSSSTDRKLELLRQQRLSAFKENYNPSSTFQLSMSELCSMIRDKTGLLIMDVNGSINSVSFKKDSINNSLAYNVSMLHGPPGNRSAESCGYLQKSPNIYPKSRFQFRDFMREQERHLNRSASAYLNAKDHLSYQKVSENTAILRRFDEEFTRRIDCVMGELDMQKSHHLTRWAVLLHFLLITWNTAMVRGNFNYLTDDFDNRWNKEFEARTVLSNGRTSARIEESVKLLMYTCATPTCGAWGMCNEMCFHCKTSSKATSSTSTTPVQKGYQHFWKAYLKSLGTNKASATRDLFLATTDGAQFIPSAKKTNPQSSPATKSFVNITEYYAFIETHQELIVPHASPFKNSN